MSHMVTIKVKNKYSEKCTINTKVKQINIHMLFTIINHEIKNKRD